MDTTATATTTKKLVKAPPGEVKWFINRSWLRLSRPARRTPRSCAITGTRTLELSRYIIKRSRPIILCTVVKLVGVRFSFRSNSVLLAQYFWCEVSFPINHITGSTVSCCWYWLLLSAGELSFDRSNNHCAYATVNRMGQAFVFADVCINGKPLTPGELVGLWNHSARLMRKWVCTLPIALAIRKKWPITRDALGNTLDKLQPPVVRGTA